MAKYDIEIIETLSGVFEVEAESPQEARDIAENLYREGEIVLDGYSNSNCDYEVKAL